MYFNRPEWDEQYPVFASDIKPSLEDMQEWEFEVYCKEKKELTISFNNVENIPDIDEVYLLDLSRSQYSNLRENKDYTFIPVYSVSRFKVVVGSRDDIDEQLSNLIPSKYVLGKNYPNPFNPETTIPFDAPEEMELSLKIYNVLGQEVKTLYEGRVQPGRSFFSWDGKNYAGKNVPGGVYIYSVKLKNGQRYSGKMILMK